MNSIEKSAKTKEEAIDAALKELNASISDVDIKVLDEGSKGLFGLFGSRLARVLVTLKSGAADEADELDISSLLADKKPERKPAPKPERKPAPKAEKPAKPAAEKPAEDKPAAEKPAEDKPAAKPERRPEPVRRQNPARRPAPKAEDAEETAAADDADADDTQDAAQADRPRRSRHRGRRRPAQDRPAGDAETADRPERAPLPPKQVVKPVEKPVVTMIPDEELDAESPAGKARAFLQEITHLMGVDVEIRMGLDQENNIFAYMTGDTLGILIGRRGETLDALQYLTSLKVNRGQEGYTRVTLDTENYRAKREDTLVRLANRMANRAVKTGRKVALEPMNPYERRIIHSALQPNEAVDTHSEGEEPNRHVVITVRKA